MFVKTEPFSRAGVILNKAMVGGDAACAALLMLLVHFNEQEDKMFINVGDTAIATDLYTTKLPWTSCIVVCDMFVKTIILISVKSLNHVYA